MLTVIDGNLTVNDFLDSSLTGTTPCAGVCTDFLSYLPILKVPDSGHPGLASDTAETKKSPVYGDN